MLLVVYQGLNFISPKFSYCFWDKIKPNFNFVVQHYSRDLFLFLYLLLVLASALTSLKKHADKSAAAGKSIFYLNRHQTEEWKGWMQVCLVHENLDF